jgi:hypothetical protein
MTDTMNMHAALAALKTAENTGRLGRVTVGYWEGGGLPPPHHHTHQVFLYVLNGTETIEFERTRYDERFKPSALQEMWRLAASPDDVRDLVRRINATDAFTTSFPEESDLDVADVRRFVMFLCLDQKEVRAKRFARRMPDHLGPLLAIFDRLKDRAMKEGQRTLYHGAVIVEDPPGGLSGGD